jgi:lipopolysaccharide export LptBFGC system permease protein LptF
MRLMRVPMIAGLLLSLAHVGIRGFAEPWSEQRLDRIGQQARMGDFGVSVRAGELRYLSKDVTFLADQVDQDSGRLGDVFVQAQGATMTARFARLRNGGGEGMLLMLEDGVMLRDRRSMRFHTLNVPLRSPKPAWLADR